MFKWNYLIRNLIYCCLKRRFISSFSPTSHFLLFWATHSALFTHRIKPLRTFGRKAKRVVRAVKIKLLTYDDTTQNRIA